MCTYTTHTHTYQAAIRDDSPVIMLIGNQCDRANARVVSKEDGLRMAAVSVSCKEISLYFNHSDGHIIGGSGFKELCSEVKELLQLLMHLVHHMCATRTSSMKWYGYNMY